ncbi:transmembrane and ubiquitin-like domain-containing protein 1 [Anolis sagrei]|uniref:transmembrane and ubiquitin-like domain-containing protein 1 n=1 Tax=Anolis sagrei TaxID=38937 RepID=UPI003521B035
MALIEGVGDEVTALFGLVGALLVLALAWLSTRTAGPAPASPNANAASGQEPPGGREVAAAPNEEEEGEGEGEEPPGSRREAEAEGELRHRANASPAPQETPSTGTGTTTTSAGAATQTGSGGGGDSGSFILRLKFLNDTERLARVRPEDTVGALKRAQFPGQEQLVRLIFQGQLLGDDTQTLGALQLSDRSVLHCYISSQRHRAEHQPQAGGPRSHPGHGPALQVGSLMMPLFVLMLGGLWYFQLQYRHLFTATATACLAGLTLLFSAMAFAVYRR